MGTWFDGPGVGPFSAFLQYVMLIPPTGIRPMTISSTSPSVLPAYGPANIGGAVYGGFTVSALKGSRDGCTEVAGEPTVHAGIGAEMTYGSAVLVKVAVSTTWTGGGCDS